MSPSTKKIPSPRTTLDGRIPRVDPGLRRGALRFGAYLATIFFVLVLNFLLPRLLPGDPIDGLVAQSSQNFSFGEKSRVSLEKYYGIDRPLPQQFGNYLARLRHGDLGRTIATNTPVREELARRLPWTILLIGSSLLLATAIGLALGVHSGWRRGRRTDRALLVGLLAVREFPPFLLGSLLLFVLAVKLRWLPLFGAETPFSSSHSTVSRALDIGKHLVLPALVLTIGLTAGSFMIMRAGMVNELGADYLLLGRAKGLPERKLKYRYAARNALLPVVSLTALQLSFVVTGDALIERVFAYPGLGNLIFTSITARDYPAIQGAFLVVALSVVTFNALADMLYHHLDPRTSE